MNKMKFMVLFMSITMIFSGCASMNNTGKGAAIGGGSGAALGAILGGVIGQSHLPPYMLPRRIHFIPCFPQNNSNKIDRNQLLKYITQ